MRAKQRKEDQQSRLRNFRTTNAPALETSRRILPIAHPLTLPPALAPCSTPRPPGLITSFSLFAGKTFGRHTCSLQLFCCCQSRRDDPGIKMMGKSALFYIKQLLLCVRAVKALTCVRVCTYITCE